MEARLADQEEQSTELVGHSEDLLAICGSRMYVFFIDAAVTERLLTEGPLSLLAYLQEEEALQAAGGGKLRKSILTGCSSEPCMAAVRAMAIVCDAVLWPLLRAVKPSAEKHVLDVLPVVWPTALKYFKAAAAAPAGVVDGSSRLDLGGHALTVSTAAQATRSARGRLDMERIREKAKGDPLVERLLTAAFAAMADATENHAAEWLGPDGKLCAGKITPEMRERYDALPSTSTSVERLHAIGRRVDDSGGVQRYENRAGVSLAMYNDQAAWLEKKASAALSSALKVAREAERQSRRQTLKARAVEVGRAKQEGREEKLSSKRERRAKAAADKARIEKLALATKYSELVKMSVDDLKDQLKAYKLQGKNGFKLTHEKRADYVLQVQLACLRRCGLLRVRAQVHLCVRRCSRSCPRRWARDATTWPMATQASTGGACAVASTLTMAASHSRRRRPRAG
jgi:hypothetical protein